MLRILLLSFAIILLPVVILAQELIFGSIEDATTGEMLPFATISFTGTVSGTVSNGQGQFSLQVPELLPTNSLTISYIGYESVVTTIAELRQNPRVKLTPAITQLEELVILPLTPEQYLKRAIRKYPLNYANQPFWTQAYYREVFTENKEYITLNEGVFQSSYPNFQDTIPNLHQLVLYRERSDKEDVDFMKEWVEDKEAKDRKKAIKRGEEWNDEDENTRDVIRVGFGGPEQILEMDLMKDSEECLDTTKFKKFKYQYGRGLNYQGRDLLEILFESRGQVEHMKTSGVIYLDVDTDAIVGVEYEGELIIPLLIKPILLAFGLAIKEPMFSKKLHYQYVDGRWYPDSFQWDVATRLKKRYVFQANEESTFTGHQIFKVNELRVNHELSIPDSLTFDPEKDPKSQVKPTGLDWGKINTLPVETIGNK